MFIGMDIVLQRLKLLSDLIKIVYCQLILLFTHLVRLGETNNEKENLKSIRDLIEYYYGYL